MNSDPLSNQKIPQSIFFCLGIQWEDISFGKEYLDFVLDQDKDFSGIKVKKELSNIYDCVRFYQIIYCF